MNHSVFVLSVYIDHPVFVLSMNESLCICLDIYKWITLYLSWRA